MKYNHVGIPTTVNFDGEIPLPHLKVTVSDHQNNPFGIQWQRYWDDAPYPDLVKTVPHVAFEVDDLTEAIRDKKVIIAPNSPSVGVLVAIVWSTAPRLNRAGGPRPESGLLPECRSFVPICQERQNQAGFRKGPRRTKFVFGERSDSYRTFTAIKVMSSGCRCSLR